MKGKIQKQQEAKERQEQYDKLSLTDKINKIGSNNAKRQREKFSKLLEEEELVYVKETRTIVSAGKKKVNNI